MAMHAAFLRGMNLGRRRVRNEELCECFVSLGFHHVSAFLASGNVLFDSEDVLPKELAVLIEAGLQRRFNYPVPTFVRSAKKVAAIAAFRPFSEATLSTSSGKVQVALLSNRPNASKKKSAIAFATDEDHLCVHGQEMYWLPMGGLTDSALPIKSIGAALGPMTMRTHRTLIRLAGKLNPA